MTENKQSRRTSKNDKLYDTKNQKFNFEEFEDNLDDTFLVEYKNINRKRRSAKQKEINKALEKELKKETKEKPKKISNNKNKKSIIIVILLLLLLLFIPYHFISINKKPKVIEKEKKVTVIDDNYLFLGDSITDFYDLKKYYKNLPVVNSGISGNVTKDILNDMNERVYKYNPSKVFLLIGTNDLEQEVSKDEIISNIEKIVKGIKENRPYAKIYVESIYPVEEENAGKRKNKDIKEINKNIEKMCKKEHVDYIDMYSKLKDDDDKLKEEYSKDGLHISNKGYEEITKVIKTYLK